MKASVLVCVILALSGCATIESDPAPTVTRVISGGMRMPDDEACAIATDKDGNTELVSCSRK